MKIESGFFFLFLTNCTLQDKILKGQDKIIEG